MVERKGNNMSLVDYFTGKKTHPLYGKGKAVEYYKALKVHANGEVPDKLLLERRPNESAEVFKYRTDNFKSNTVGPYGKIVNTLSKIRRSPDWSIRYDLKEVPAKIKDGERLNDYCEYKYPVYTSLTNWVFKVLLKSYLVDANGVVVVKPKTFKVEPTQYLSPVAYIYHSDTIVEFTDDICILKDGDNFWVIDREYFYYYIKTKKNEYVKEFEEYHNLGILPVFKMQGNIVEDSPKYTLFESRIMPIVPSFDEANTEYSDFQASMRMFVYPERWEYEGQSCQTCWDASQKRSTGFVKIIGLGKENNYQTCTSCNGTGSGTKSGPYSSMVIRGVKTNMGEQQAPIPPAGYIEKNVEIPKFQVEVINSHLYNALSAINMEHLAEVPMAESGVAKAQDRDDFNNFVHSIAEDIVYIMDMVYFLINEYRYRIAVPEYSERQKMLPYINVPENYDLLIANSYVAEIKQAKDAGIATTIIAKMQRQYAAAKLNLYPETLKEVNAVFELDPLQGYSPEQKVTLKDGQAISDVDYVISTYIEYFVQRAIIEDKGFLDKDYKAKRAVIVKYANEIIATNTGTDVAVIGGGGDQPSAADLRYTVGGTTGIIALVTAVQAGTMTKESAIELLKLNFGYSAQEAEIVIGNPPEINNLEDAKIVQTLT